jgi:hypothetical protein
MLRGDVCRSVSVHSTAMRCDAMRRSWRSWLEVGGRRNGSLLRRRAMANYYDRDYNRKHACSSTCLLYPKAGHRNSRLGRRTGISKSGLDLDETQNQTDAKIRKDKITQCHPNKPHTKRLHLFIDTICPISQFSEWIVDPSPLVGARLNDVDDPFFTASPLAVQIHV